jgi:hypothetical protein
MPANSKALSVVLTIAATMLHPAKPIALRFMSGEDSPPGVPLAFCALLPAAMRYRKNREKGNVVVAFSTAYARLAGSPQQRPAGRAAHEMLRG